MFEWVEIVIPATPSTAEDVAALIATEVDAAQQGTQIASGEVVFWAPADQVELALEQTRRAVARLAGLGLVVDAQSILARPAVPEAEWRDAWKRHFHTARLTRQVVVVPSWETFTPAPGDHVIALDPGQAFGTGLHASTRLVLGEMQALCDQGGQVTRFLDLGTGSGILAIACARLWPDSSGVAIDIDPLAVAAATENAAANQVADRIACQQGDDSPATPAFDLLLANIQADVLFTLCDHLAARARPDATVILSGLLVGQVDAVAAHYTGHGQFTLEHTRRSEEDPEWSCARLRRSPAS